MHSTLQSTTLLLNCDLGESLGPWIMGRDPEVMPLIDMANIACGFHASDPLTMNRTVQLAVQSGTMIGAHPAYPDLVGFGRRSMQCSMDEITAMVRYQVGALAGICRAHGTTVRYIKPHGALYNDMHRDNAILRAVMQAASDYDGALALMVLAQADNGPVQKIADEFGVPLILEAFADRVYTDNGQLMPRNRPGAVVSDRAGILKQVEGLAANGTVVTESGRSLVLSPDSLCVHGDNTQAVAAIQAIRDLIGQRRATG